MARPNTKKRTPGRPTKPTGPVVIKRRDRTAEEDADPGILVFTISDSDGDADYFMPRRIPAGFSLQALEEMQEMGEVAAAAWLLKEVLGEDAYDALKGDPDLEPEQLEQIVSTVTQHVMGQMEAGGKG